MGQVPELLLIGDGRLARHFSRYFEQLGLSYVAWSRRAEAEGRSRTLAELVHPRTRALLAISDSAIMPFVTSRPELAQATRVHFSGRLVTPVAHGAHPLFSFAGTLYERGLYERIPFILDEGAPSLSELIPGIPNAEFRIEPGHRARYHALCVLAGNFTTLLWRKLFFELDWELGLPREQALPYLESIVRGLSGGGAPLSGPLARGDRATVDANLKALAGDPFEQVYRAFVAAYELQAKQRPKTEASGAGKDWLSP
jgi:predicted short-subunit dehydrogenase-like oxidoreductase (DUF2520 family)